MLIKEKEVKKIPNLHRKSHMLEVLEESNIFIPLTDKRETRAKILNAMGIKPLDALHLACAEAATADYFCTCDDKLLKKAKALTDSQIRAVSPLELIVEVKEP